MITTTPIPLDRTEIRNNINSIDIQLLNLLFKRRQLAIKMAQYKQHNDLPVRDTSRESELINTLQQQGKSLGISSDFIEKMYRLVIEDSVQLQEQFLLEKQTSEAVHNTKDIRIAFLGPVGSYSHIATMQYAKQNNLNYFECGEQTFQKIFHLVSHGLAEYGIVPLSNTSSGSINEVYDLLQAADLSIIGEIHLVIEHCLLTAGNTTVEKIETVYSHPQPIQQCSQSLADFPHWKIEYCESTGAAMQKVADIDSPFVAAIGSAAGGSLYNLQPLQPMMANQTENYTRFIVISKQPTSVSAHIPAQTSLILSTGQQAGSLVDVLLVLKKQSLVMNKLESRPIPGNLLEEMFYLDILGNIDTPIMQEALNELKKLCRTFRILGCYPIASI